VAQRRAAKTVALIIASEDKSQGKADQMSFGYIACMGLSTGMSRQKCFKYFCQKISEI
jgi:hypothetical protein